MLTKEIRDNKSISIKGVKVGETTITSRYEGKESSVKFTVKDTKVEKNNSKKKIIIGLVVFGVVAIITMLAILIW